MQKCRLNAELLELMAALKISGSFGCKGFGFRGFSLGFRVQSSGLQGLGIDILHE